MALKLNASINKKSIVLNKPSDKPEHFLTFTFCSKYDCTITIHFGVVEKIGSTNTLKYGSYFIMLGSFL